MPPTRGQVRYKSRQADKPQSTAPSLCSPFAELCTQLSSQTRESPSSITHWYMTTATRTPAALANKRHMSKPKPRTLSLCMACSSHSARTGAHSGHNITLIHTSTEKKPQGEVVHSWQLGLSKAAHLQKTLLPPLQLRQRQTSSAWCVHQRPPATGSTLRCMVLKPRHHTKKPSIAAAQTHPACSTQGTCLHQLLLLATQLTVRP